MTIGFFFTIFLSFIPLFVLSCVFDRYHKEGAAQAFACASIAAAVIGMGGGGWLIHEAGKEHAFTQACRDVVARNTDTGLVATCVPHLAAIDAAEAAQKAERQASKDRENDEIVRAQARGAR